MTAQPQAGDQAPDFTLPIGAAGPLRLGALKGSKVVLYFYPTDDTETCTAEAIAFNGLRAEFARAHTEIIGISPNSLASHEKFKSQAQARADARLGRDQKRSSKPMGSGGKRACSAANIWASNAPPC